MDALLFFPLAVMIALTPGPNNFCALNHGIRHGVRAALVGTCGRVAAFAIFLAISAIGLGAMLLASEAAFTAVKWAGAAYLFYLGARAWRSTDFGGAPLAGDEAATTAAGAPQPPGASLRQLVRQEFLLGISNPKAIILFAAIFPQFIDPAKPALRQFAVLGATYLLAEFVSSLAYATGGRQIRRVIRSSKGVARLNKATGGFFIGAGGLLMAAHR
ncbi:LysE family transporter [Ramlibacter sp. H39-3-26]|uniref:LysE family translocator n=1 Tax=Curvibacter soli TaxID=3031331 RepID=UPI0023DB4282|nr:LysE family transporter [Ramlibacter sp. H39-3-26]MDF1485350.1 LysE family transporter [Ramlibacter sp. H39-3-26]